MKTGIWSGTLFVIIACITCLVLAAGAAAEQPVTVADAQLSTDIPAYQPRFGRDQPVIAVLADNEMTELTDFVVPYAVLTASGSSKVITVAPDAGPVQLYPALRIQPDSTLAGFDQAYPQGADFVIVPAIHNVQASKLQNWLKAQSAKGARIVGICDGAWVLAHAGLLASKKAVGFWYSMGSLQKQFPDTTWLRNQRYVADGNVMTTTGVTASLPASIALVAAIAGTDKANALAKQLGLADWSARHDSRQFHLSTGAVLTLAGNWLRFWAHDEVALPLREGVDDIALALYADAWSRTYRSQVVGVALDKQTVSTRYGLHLLPDATLAPEAFARLSEQHAWLHETASAGAVDKALKELGQTYGKSTRSLVSLFLEYPQ